MEIPYLKITSSVAISIGESKSNIVGKVVQHAYTNESGGLTIPSDLNWWLDTASYDAGKDQVWPLGAADAKIKNSEITLTQAESMAANLPITIYEKIADSIESANPGIAVEVIVS